MAVSKPMMIYSDNATIGCDPEVFARDKEGTVVASDVLIPAKGLLVDGGYGLASVVRDGVQIELHPSPTSCRANVSNSLQKCFRTLAKAATEKGLQISFDQVVTLDKKALAGMSEDAQRLRCLPSFNAYNAVGQTVDGKKYRKRSGAGHIHVGSGVFGPDKTYIDHNKGIKAFDMLVGIPAVLCDRDPGAAERRKVYGLAGEYRLPSHGVEYRTLSNFWLRNYALFSLFAGMAKIAHGVAITEYYVKRHAYIFKATGMYDRYHDRPMEILMDGVDEMDLQDAINHNDFDLALKIYDKHVEPFLKTVKSEYGIMGQRQFSPSSGNLDEFRHFFTKIKEEGLGYWFKEEPLQHWLTKREGHGTGWEDGFVPTIRADMAATKKKIIKVGANVARLRDARGRFAKVA